MNKATIIRHRTGANYTCIPNAMLNDDNLSWKAKGILCYLLSKPDDWKPQVTDLTNHGSNGNGSVSSGLLELRQRGYAQLQRHMKEGRVTHWLLVISDQQEFTQCMSAVTVKVPEQQQGFQELKNQVLENQDLENRGCTNTKGQLKTEKKQKTEFVIPDSLNEPTFLKAWADWLSERKVRHQPVTVRAAALQLKKLAAMGPARAVRSIETSIERGWIGLFESREDSERPVNGESVRRDAYGNPLEIWENAI